MSVSSYRDLKVWQLSVQAALAIYRMTQTWPREELYGLTQQIRRAAVSIPSNIAEGNERKSSKEYLHHLSIALGSRAELETQLHLAIELGYCSAHETMETSESLREVGRMLQGLYESIQRHLANP